MHSAESLVSNKEPAPEVTRAERIIMEKLLLQTCREGYGIDQIRRTMTIGELIDFLGNYDEDTPVYLSFDNGYTYGGITDDHFEEHYEEDSNEEDDEAY